MPRVPIFCFAPSLELSVTNLTTRALTCAFCALLSSACGKPAETIFAAAGEQNIGATGGSQAGAGGTAGMDTGGSGGMTAGTGGMATAGNGGTMMMDSPDATTDAGVPDAATDDGDAAVDNADAAAEPTTNEVCTTYCNAKQAFADSSATDACETVDIGGCVGQCIGQNTSSGPPACIPAWDAVTVCLTTAAFECDGTTVYTVETTPAACNAEVLQAAVICPSSQ